MKKPTFLIVFVLMIALAVSGNALAKSDAQMKKGKSKSALNDPSQTANPKIDAFLRALEKAQSPSDWSDTFTADQFTRKELEILKSKLQDPKYKSKIDRFKRQAEKQTGHKATKHQGKSLAQIRSEKLRQLERAHRQKVNQLNKRVQDRVSRLQSSMPAKGKGPSLANRVSPDAVQRAPRRLPRDNAGGSITSPNHLIVGETVTIEGTGFGDRTGRVALIIGEDLFECPVSAWRDRRIRAVIPESLQPEITCSGGRITYAFLEDERESGIEPTRTTLWVKRAGGETGPTKVLGIYPDLDRLVPEITSVYPEQLTPGGEFIIEGRNFMETDHPRDDFAGNLSIRFMREELDIRIYEWRDSYIRALVPLDVSEMAPYSTGSLRIENCARNEANYSRFGFTPAEEIILLESGEHSASCKPAAFFPCMFGTEYRKTFFETQLAENWAVEECWLEARTRGINAGAYFHRQPPVGSTNPRTIVVFWADGFSRVEAEVFLSIKGPRGLDY
jgi:hypothetical protein